MHVILLASPPQKRNWKKVTYAAAISACENRIAWEAALVLLDDAKRDLASLILGDKDVEVRLSKQSVKCFQEENKLQAKSNYFIWRWEEAITHLNVKESIFCL